MSLLATGNAAPAAILLERVLADESGNLAAMEAYARALYDANRFGEAVDAFTALVDRAPDDDYARYGLGLALWRMQRFQEARDELAMALVMRPERTEYAQALSQVKATLRARTEAGLPLDGPLPKEGL